MCLYLYYKLTSNILFINLYFHSYFLFFSGGFGRGGGGRGRGRGGGARRDRELIGTTIKITGGPYKGNVGIVKDAIDTTARVELHSTCQTISVDRSHIANVAVLTKDGGFSSYNRTPAYGGGQTPMYARDGSKTPMHGSQTPMYESKFLKQLYKYMIKSRLIKVNMAKLTFNLILNLIFNRWFSYTSLWFDDTISRWFTYTWTIRSLGSSCY